MCNAGPSSLAPWFWDYYARYAGEPCALQRATKDYEAALLAFHQWERARIAYVLTNMPR